VGVDHQTFITPIPTFPPQGGRRLRVMDPVATGTSPQGEGFPVSRISIIALLLYLELEETNGIPTHDEIAFLFCDIQSLYKFDAF